MPSLFVIQGQNKGTRYDLLSHSGAISIGRESANHIQLRDNEASRRHAEVSRVGEFFVIYDLNSSNGTFVNKQKIEKAELSSGDQLQIGRTLLVYSGDTEDLDSIDLVDIVPSHADGSRIIRSLPEDDIDNLVIRQGPDDTQNLRLSNARKSLQVMYRTALAVSHTLDIDELLRRILELVFDWINADRGCIMLKDPISGALEARARRDRAGVSSGSSMTISRTILDYVLERREGVLTSDAQDDERFSSGNSVMQSGIREAICVPMQGRYGTVGALYVDTTTPLSEVVESSSPRFTEEHLKLLIAIAHQAALAVEDTNYYSAMIQSERLAAVGQTVATLSHHIKNILQGIRGGSYLIEMGLNDHDEVVLRKGWSIVDRNQQKISSLVMDMLSFGKTREPEMLPSNLIEVVAEVIDTVRQRATDAGIEIVWNPHANMQFLKFDPDGLSRAILNVVTNAIDAAQDRPDPKVCITVELDRSNNTASVIVSDNGEGIHAQALPNIFVPFVSTKGSRGTGLGLAVSQKILKEHGGDINVTSSPGSGSTFRLEFPLIEMDPHPDQSKQLDTLAEDQQPDGPATRLGEPPSPDLFS